MFARVYGCTHVTQSFFRILPACLFVCTRTGERGRRKQEHGGSCSKNRSTRAAVGPRGSNADRCKCGPSSFLPAPLFPPNEREKAHWCRPGAAGDPRGVAEGEWSSGGCEQTGDKGIWVYHAGAVFSPSSLVSLPHAFPRSPLRPPSPACLLTCATVPRIAN